MSVAGLLRLGHSNTILLSASLASILTAEDDSRACRLSSYRGAVLKGRAGRQCTVHLGVIRPQEVIAMAAA